jgi:hypothetical protein
MSAAIKLVLKDGDGDDFDTTVDSIAIKVVNNGYIIETIYDTEEVYTEVCLNVDTLLKTIEERIKA